MYGTEPKRIVFYKLMLVVIIYILITFVIMEISTKTKEMNIGHKISRIRELRGMKQGTLAAELGVSQQTISKLEQNDVVDEPTLNKIAEILGVTIDGLKNYSDEAVINYFNTFNDHSGTGAFFSSTNNNCTFNPIEKVVALYEEKISLLERLLESEKEKLEILKKNIDS